MQSILPSQTTIHSLVSSCFLLSLVIPFGAASFICFNANNYTQGSLYESNLKLNLNTLASNITPNGFYKITSGAIPDLVYGLLQCRGDVSSDDCQICADNNAEEIIKQCPNQKEAVIYDFNCMLHYADYRFFSTVDTSQEIVLYTVQNTTNPDSFYNQLQDLLDKLSANAASDPKLFSTGTNFTRSSHIYGLVQCTRDLSKSSCLKCLKELKPHIYGKLDGGYETCQVLSRPCLMRYETYPFFESSVSPPPPPALQPTAPTTPTTTTPSNNITTNSGGGKKNFIIPIVIPVAVLSVLICALCVILFWRRSARRKNGVKEYWMKSTESLMFDLSSLRTATNNFSDSYKLGEGGFGSVYKGILPDGREIAVKRLSLKSTQGLKELKTEVVLVAKLLHRNLVRLLGFCLEEEEKLLVYEYLSNGSLDTFLFDQGKRLLLDWDKRYRIIVGIARGLLYLHEDSQVRIIHRDLKASNILLDEKMNPKISDFGLARLFAESQAQANTNHIAGTFGYMSPEYIMNGHFSIKSDVFSFGVLVLEIVTGRKNNSFRNANLLSYAWQHWSEGTALEMVDATLRAQHMPNDMLKCLQLGLLCVQEDAIDRPTMSQVLLLLSTNNVTCPVPSRPAYFVKRVRTESDISKESSSVIMSTQSTNTFSLPSANEVNEVTLSDIYPR